MLYLTSNETIVRVRIFGLNGRKVFQQSLNENNPIVDLTELTSTVYVLGIGTKTSVKRVKLLKQ